MSGVVGQLQEFERMTGIDLRSALVGNFADMGSALVERLTLVAGNVLAGLTELSIILLSMFFSFAMGRGASNGSRNCYPWRRNGSASSLVGLTTW